jgi:hypothetical protein
VNTISSLLASGGMDRYFILGHEMNINNPQEVWVTIVIVWTTQRIIDLPPTVDLMPKMIHGDDTSGCYKNWPVMIGGHR